MKKILNLLQIAGISFLFLSKVCYAVPSNSISIPNSFTPNTIISSSAVNANYNEVQTKFNAHSHTDITQLGTITTGNWNATAIATQYGGTGQDFSAIAQGAIPYFSATGTISTLTAGTSGQILKTQGASANPAWITVFPASSTDNAVVRWDGTGGATFQDSIGATIDDTGRYTNTSQPCFIVRKSAAQSNIAVATAVTVTFDTEVVDVGNNFATNTFTAPITGKYLFTVGLNIAQFDVTANNSIIVSIITSNRTYEVGKYAQEVVSDSTVLLTISAIADMDVSDTAYISVYIGDAGSVVQTDIDTGNPTFFSGMLLS